MHQPAVVVLTGDRDAGRHAIAGGAQDFLLKPIELDDLFAAVHRYGEAQA
jgi:FixJ family two-component response regulator